jgi:hypothetical protein
VWIKRELGEVGVVEFSELGCDDFRNSGDIKVIVGSAVGDIPSTKCGGLRT